MTDLVIRPLVAGEEELFLSFPDPNLVGPASTGPIRDVFAAEKYRPEWLWVALRGGTVVARAGWYGGPEDAEPGMLNWFDFDDPEAGVALLRAAPFRVDYCLVLPPDWRDYPAVKAQADARIDAAERAGMKRWIERLRYTWTPAAGVPARTGRLEYRPEPDDDVVLDVLRRIHTATLDGHSLRHGDPDSSAKDELEFLLWLPGPRDWWRMAYTPDGEVVGLTVPSRNYFGPVIGVIGVVPEQRGHGYGYDLLVEATHVLVEHGAERIAAATDVGNAPMAAGFARAGYPITQRHLFLTH
jgi:RimJ/RimL family protein N-acetyltransferase